MPHVFIVWGENDTIRSHTMPGCYGDAVYKYTFATQAELDAFLLGVDEAYGISTYEVFDSEAEAKEYVRDICKRG